MEKRDLGNRLSKAAKELCEFCLDLGEAEANVEIAAAGVIMSVMRAGDWRAAVSFLERRHAECWAPRRIRATVPTKEPGESRTTTEPPPEATREQLKAALAPRGWSMDIFREGRDPEPAEPKPDLCHEVCDGLVRSLR